jgi:hypothetical protein
MAYWSAAGHLDGGSSDVGAIDVGREAPLSLQLQAEGEGVGAVGVVHHRRADAVLAVRVVQHRLHLVAALAPSERGDKTVDHGQLYLLQRCKYGVHSYLCG